MLKVKRTLSSSGILTARNIVESEWPERERSDLTMDIADNILRQLLNNPSVNIYIGYLDSKPIASGSLYILPTFRNGFSCVAQIENLVVLPEFRGHGYGKEMVYNLIEIAKQTKPVYKVVLNCSDENIPFYERCGFYQNENQMRLDIW